MQPARELTPLEVEEGKRNINDRQLTATEVQALVRKMDASKTKWKRLRDTGSNNAYEQMVKQENEFLYFNYPSLFDMHLRDSLDGTFFEMLTLKRKIERGEITPEQASTIVGQKLFQRYVPEALDSNAPAPAPQMSYEEYYRRNQE
jgi:hypothetical protein